MKYLYLAEKPSAMKDVKAAYNASSKPLGDIDFFALTGHICRLCEPKEYEDWDVRWADRKLPMIPEPFKVGVLTDNKVKELKEQLKKEKYDAIIVGTDSDVEGNGIYDLIETYLGLQNYKTYRFFESDLTPAGIMKSMNNLTDYHSNPRDVGMTQSFRIRSRFDWLIGFNMTVAYTVKSGFLMKVGRVKAPTLKLVYDNCKAIDGFSSKTAYQPAITTDNPEVTAYMIDDEGKAASYPDKNDAQKIIDSLTGEAEVLSFDKTTKKTQPDQLYKLTDIQVEAGSKYGYTPEKTLELIQSLYEKHKLISYPRTGGRYVSTEKSKDFARLLKAVEAMPGLTDIAKAITPDAIKSAQANKRFVNDAEVQKSSHDALIPTGETSAINNLTGDEMNICEMIFKRFLAIFMPPLEEEKTKAVLSDNGIKFSCTGSKVLKPGFTVLFSNPKEAPLPNMAAGQKLKEKEKSLHEIVSKPPARFTQATLLEAMENVQKYMAADETELKNAMKKAGGIGQPSSRAAIIAELVSTGYMEDVKSGRGKGLHITESGKRYIENLGTSSIVSPELSAQWEVYMNDIREGNMTYDEVYEKVIEYVYQSLKELEGIHIQKVASGNRKEVGKCPKCGKPVVALSKGYGCSGYPDCDFSIFKTIAGVSLTDKNVADLLAGRTTDVISGFKKKNGGTFSAALVLNEEHKVSWAPFENKTDLVCPKCGKPIIKTPATYKCSECDFILWSKICEKTLTEAQVAKLIEGEPTGVIKGFKRKDGSKFDAALIIKDGKLVWYRPEAKDTGLKCPKCGKPIMDNGKAFECQGKKDDTCTFSVWKEPGGKPFSMKDMEQLQIRDILRGNNYPSVGITVSMEALLNSAMNQNFIPVVDDLGNFTGIVTRKDIIRYFSEEKNAAEPQVLRKIV